MYDAMKTIRAVDAQYLYIHIYYHIFDILHIVLNVFVAHNFYRSASSNIYGVKTIP